MEKKKKKNLCIKEKHENPDSCPNESTSENRKLTKNHLWKMYFYFHLLFVDITIYLTFISCLIGANDIVIQVLKHFIKFEKKEMYLML